MTHKHHIEAVATLASGQPVHYVRCTDCQNWNGSKCSKGRPATLPDYRIRICGEYLPTEATDEN